MTDLSRATLFIRVNGEDEPLRARSVEGLLAEKEIPADMRGIAVALNGRVVPRAEWRETAASETFGRRSSGYRASLSHHFSRPAGRARSRSRLRP